MDNNVYDNFLDFLGDITETVLGVSSASQQFVVTFLPKYRVQLLGYDRLVFIRF